MKCSFLVLFLLLFLFCPNVFAQDSGLPEYGKQWLSFSKFERTLYVNGYYDGIQEVQVISKVFVLGCDCSNTKDTAIDRLQRVFKERYDFIEKGFGYSAVADVVTDLYKDPANIYINFSFIIHVAADKLSGKDVSDTLVRLRKTVIDAHEGRKKILKDR